MDLLELKKKQIQKKLSNIKTSQVQTQNPEIQAKFKAMSAVVQKYLESTTQASSTLVHKLFSVMRSSGPNAHQETQAKFEPLFDIVSQLQKELQQLYSEYQKNVTAKDDFSAVDLSTVKQDLASLIQLLSQMHENTQSIFNSIQYVVNDEKMIHLRWESAYLANMASRFSKDLTKFYSDPNIWGAQPAQPQKKYTEPETSVMPSASPTNDPHNQLSKVDTLPKTQVDPLGLFEDDKPDEYNEFGDLPMAAPKTDSDKDTQSVEPQKPPVVINESNSKITPLPSNDLTRIRGYSLTKPEGAMFDIGQQIQVGFMKYNNVWGKVIGYSRGDLHKISYIFEYTTVKGEKRLYEFEPYTGMRGWEKPQ